MTAIIMTTSDAALRIEFLGALEVEEGDSAQTCCLNGGECDGCIDKPRCYGEES